MCGRIGPPDGDKKVKSSEKEYATPRVASLPRSLGQLHLKALSFHHIGRADGLSIPLCIKRLDDTVKASLILNIQLTQKALDGLYTSSIMINRKCALLRPLLYTGSHKSNRIHLSNQQRQSLSTSRPSFNYSDTVSNLRIGHHTKVIFQGFTGRQVSFIYHSFEEAVLKQTARRLKMPNNPLSMGPRLSVASRLAEIASTLDFLYCRLYE